MIHSGVLKEHFKSYFLVGFILVFYLPGALFAQQSNENKKKKSIPSLMNLLNDPQKSYEEKTRATDEIAAIGKDAKAAAPTLNALLPECMLDNRPEKYCQALVNAIGSLGPASKDAVPYLTYMLDQEKDDRNAGILLDALSGIGPEAKSAIPTIARMLNENSDCDWMLKSFAIDTLIDIAPKSETVHQVLTKALDDSCPLLQIEVVAALNRVAPSPRRTIPVIVAVILDPDMWLANRYQMEFALKVLESHGFAARRAIPALKKAKMGDNPWVRKMACNALARITPESSKDCIPTLIDWFKPEENSTSMITMTTLAKMGFHAKAAVPTLEKWLDMEKTQERLRVADTLQKIAPDDPRPLPIFIEGLSDKDSYMRCIAARYLKDLGPKAYKALPELRLLLSDEDEEVRKAAENAILSIEGVLK